MKLNDFRIGVRLGGGFAVILSLLALMMLVGIWRLADVTNETRHMMDTPLAKERLAEEWFRNVAVGVRRTTAIAKSADPSLETLFAADAKASTLRGNEILKALEAIPGGDEETKLMAAVVTARKGYIGARDAIMAFRAARSPIGLGRRTDKTVITTYGRDTAVASTLFYRDAWAGAKVGRQMQTWVRFPEGWRIVAAHVSIIDEPKDAKS